MLLILLIMLVPSGFLFIHEIFAESSIETNEEIDLRLGAIEALDSVQQIPDLIFIMETLLRAPITQLKDGDPPYNQEPPDAQDDFRRSVTPPIPTLAPPTMQPPIPPAPTLAPPPPLPTMRPPMPPLPTLAPPPPPRPTRDPNPPNPPNPDPPIIIVPPNTPPNN